MTTNTVTTRTCNICDTEILASHDRVDAGVYGADFHRVCADQQAYSVAEVLGWMRIDDVESYSTIPEAMSKRYMGSRLPLGADDQIRRLVP